jgi:hypothetical protein
MELINNYLVKIAANGNYSPVDDNNKNATISFYSASIDTVDLLVKSRFDDRSDTVSKCSKLTAQSQYYPQAQQPEASKKGGFALKGCQLLKRRLGAMNLAPSPFPKLKSFSIKTNETRIAVPNSSEESFLTLKKETRISNMQTVNKNSSTKATVRKSQTINFKFNFLQVNNQIQASIHESIGESKR